MNIPTSVIDPSSFFVLRTPALSLERFAAIPATDSELNDFLCEWLDDEYVQEALYLASPSLWTRVEEQKPSLDRKLRMALLKYLVRMTTRSTPFGLFSGISRGSVADRDQLTPRPALQARRITRIDMGYLAAARSLITSELPPDVKVGRNDTAMMTERHVHYVEPYQASGQQRYRLSALHRDEAVDHALAVAETPAPLTKLAQRFIAKYDQYPVDEVLEYLKGLVEQGLLIADIALPLTTSRPDHEFLENVRGVCDSDLGASLEQAVTIAGQVDSNATGAIAKYRATFERLSERKVPVKENALFQVDAMLPFEQCSLSGETAQEISRTILALHSLTHKKRNPLSDFVSTFRQRFEGQTVPLLQALHDEMGISFSSNTGYQSELLKGLAVGRKVSNSSGSPFNSLDLKVMRNLSIGGETRMDEIRIESNTLLEGADLKELASSLPRSFCAKLSVHEGVDERPALHFQGASGPSAANLIGRFCHLSDSLCEEVRAHLREEESQSEDTIYAEVVHLPDGRPGNVIARPRLRDYEIVFFGDSAVDEDHQIPVSDLHVYIEDGIAKLWSARLGKRVIPRLSSAHNFGSRSLGIYRFLCMLQMQDTAIPNVNLHQLIREASYVPRLLIDNVIVREKHWVLDRKKLEPLSGDDAEHHFEELQKEYFLDRHVCFSVNDNVLTIDLLNPQLLEMLLNETQGRTLITLTESLPISLGSGVGNGDSTYANEILLPFINHQSKAETTNRSRGSALAMQESSREFAPGSEWMAVKLYLSPGLADKLLRDEVAALVNSVMKTQGVDKFFFIRYGDPDHHLRLRFGGDPSVLCARVLPALRAAFEPRLAEGVISKMELASYHQELERYGGVDSMPLVESIFHIDSLLVLDTLKLEGQIGSSARWRVALLWLDALCTAFDLDESGRIALISGLRDRFALEFSETAKRRKAIGKRYKALKSNLDVDFGFSGETSESASKASAALHARVDRYQKLVDPLSRQIMDLDGQSKMCCSKDALLSSIFHMHINRMFTARQREHEYVLYNFFRRVLMQRMHAKPVEAAKAAS